MKRIGKREAKRGKKTDIYQSNRTTFIKVHKTQFHKNSRGKIKTEIQESNLPGKPLVQHHRSSNCAQERIR